MKLPVNSLFFLSFLFMIISCDNKEEFNHDPELQLQFSDDHLTFDTLFSGIPSTTKQIKVYNQSSKAVYIDEIDLENSDKGYRLNINGIAGNSVRQIQIPAKDSLYIFIELSTEDNNQDDPRLIEDHIRFTFNSKVQRFLLKSWAQDVIRFSNSELRTQVWTPKRPYFIDDDLYLQQNQTLQIQAGSKVYFQKGAGLHIHGNLAIEGHFEKPVLFNSHRREELYDNVPGQWEGLFFYSESTDNHISHLQLENAIQGISAQSETNSNSLEIQYSQFLNFSSTGIETTNFNLKMNDVIVSNCGNQTIQLKGEGNFQFYHCNFINYWKVSSRSQASFSYLANENNNKKLEVFNSIILGSMSNELEIKNKSAVQINNTLIKLSEEIKNSLSNSLVNCIFNTDPEFMNINKHNYNLKAESILTNKAKLDIANLYPLDFNGNSRISDSAPDIGSFEFIEQVD